MAIQSQSVAFHRKLGRGIGKRFARGTFLLLPLMVTFWLIQFAFQTMDGLLEPIISAVAGREISGLSFGIIIAALFIVGALSSSVIFRTPGYLIELGISAIPGVGSVYSTTKKLLPGSESSSSPTGFDTVVRVEYPGRGAWAVGLLMGIIDDNEGTRYGVVYMPSTPMPQSGWLMQIPMTEVQLMNWNSADAMQYIVSAGATCPPSMDLKVLEPAS